MKAKKYWILVATVVVGIILNGCDSDTPKKTTQQAKEDETPEEVKKLCSQYDAVTDWEEYLSKKAYGQHTYTIEVEDALIRSDGRPILFHCVVDDIVRESDKYVVYWSAGFGSSAWILSRAIFTPDFRFVLDCTPSQIEKLKRQSAGTFDYYAVIAQISEVEKIRFEVTGRSSRDEDSVYEQVSINLETSDTFIAKGKCLDLFLVVKEMAKYGQKNR